MKRIIITMFMLLSFKTILFSQIKDSLIFEEYGYGAKIYKIVNKCESRVEVLGISI